MQRVQAGCPSMGELREHVQMRYLLSTTSCKWSKTYRSKRQTDVKRHEQCCVHKTKIKEKDERPKMSTDRETLGEWPAKRRVEKLPEKGAHLQGGDGSWKLL